MALKYHPRAGEIFMCSYPRDMRVPEMVKTRPVIVISPRFRGRDGLITVVPMSSTTPRTIMPYHYQLTLSHALPAPFDTNPCWVICDHPMAVSWERIDLVKMGRDQYGKRKYYQHVIDSEALKDIRTCVTKSIGI